MAESSKTKKRLDQSFFEQLLTLPSFSFYRLIRQHPEQEREQRRQWISSQTPPTFSYPKATDFDAVGYLSAIETCRERLPDGPKWIRTLYDQKLEELGMRASLVLAASQGDDQTVTHLSQKLFGQPRQTADELKREFERMLEHASTFHTHSKPVNAERFSTMVHELLAHYQLQDWQVQFHDGSSMKLTRGRRARKPRILIPSSMQITKARAARLLVHEIEVHALRTENGRRSPLHLLHVGLSGYIRTDEGLAIYLQQQLTDQPPRFSPGFWDAWTNALTQQGTFRETFSTIANARTELAKATNSQNPEHIGQDAAWRLCARAYRGISQPETYGVGFLRDHLYRSGLLDIRDLAEEQGEKTIASLFVGNIGIQHLEQLSELPTKHAQQPTLVAKEIVKRVL